MKKIIALILSLVVCLSVLAACGPKEPPLSGRYEMRGFASQTSYEFAEDKTVVFKVVVAGYVVVSQSGTYQINEDATEITLDFSSGETEGDSTYLPTDMLNGTFTFSQGEEYIQIGNMQLNKS